MERELNMETKRMPYSTDIQLEPIKQSDGIDPMTTEELEKQAEMALDCLRTVGVDVASTCVDERERVGTRDGQKDVEPRYSVPGGANVYGLYVAELINYFDGEDSDGSSRLTEVTALINDGGVNSGGHEGCAANGGFNAVMGLICGDNLDAGKEYARSQLGSEFDEGLYDEVVANARRVVESGRYAEWDETKLFDVLGDKAGSAIEQLNGKHEARTIIRVDVDGMTVDQTELHKLTNGEDSFINDEGFAGRIEAVMSDGPDAERKQQLARHAREAVMSALVVAVPNPVIHQINIR